MSKLVSEGQYKAAIDLLLEYLELDQNSSHVLSTLGRAYLLNRQPEKAIIYLKRSLEITQGNSIKENNLSKYKSDNFCNDDMDFIESQAEIFSEEDYSLDVDEAHQPTTNKETRTDLYCPAKSMDIESENNTKRVQGSYRGRKKLSLNCNDILSTEHGDCNKTEGFPKTSNSHVDGELKHANPVNVNDNPIANEKNRQPYQKSNSAIEVTTPNTAIGNESAKQPAIDKNHSSDWVDNEDFDLVENEIMLSDESFEDENDDQDEVVPDELVDSSFYYPLEEASEDLIWDDFEGLDEFNELSHREVEEEIQSDGKISREARARQIAVEVLDKSDWSPEHLSLLQKIFIENGWSATRRAIEREIDKNLQPEELVLARKIRLSWSENEQYWMTFQKIKHNAPFQQADATYKCMSWPESLRIIRSFSSLPDIEEIYTFIDDTFDHWYNSNRLRRNFKAFFKFLKYRTGSMHRTLPDSCMFSFFYPENIDVGVDSGIFCNPVTPESRELMELGLQLNQWPQPPENKIKIIEADK